MLRYFRSVYVQYTSFQCLAERTICAIFDSSTSSGENCAVFKAEDWGVLNVHRLTITQKTAQLSRYEACCYQVLPQFIELWGLNVQTDVEAKKISSDRPWNDNTTLPVKVCAVRLVDGRFGNAVDKPYQCVTVKIIPLLCRGRKVL